MQQRILGIVIETMTEIDAHLLHCYLHHFHCFLKSFLIIILIRKTFEIAVKSLMLV